MDKTMTNPQSVNLSNSADANPSMPASELSLNPSPNKGENVAGGTVDPVAGTSAPLKRKPGRPKGSGKKYADVATVTTKLKRPVGRPRKDGFPAGSGPRRSQQPKVAPTKSASTRGNLSLPGSYYPFTPGTQPQWPAAFPPQLGTAYQSASVPPMTSILHSSTGGSGHSHAPYPIDPNLDRDDWADLARTKPTSFLAALLSSLQAPNPVSSAGPSVEEAFKSHLVSLAPSVSQVQPIPSLYSILKTFWLPSSPAYFSLTASASTARTPSEHRFLYWDPQPLVFNGISCPNCSASLTNKGRIHSGPIKIYDIEKPFFIIGCEYVCKSGPCLAVTSPEGRKFASTDPSILRSLPVRLKDEFPARLLHGDIDAGSGPNIWNWQAMGVSVSLWNMVRSCLRSGLKKVDILQLIHSIQYGVDGADKKEEEEEADEEDKEVVTPGGQLDGPVNAVQITAADDGNKDDAYNNAWKANVAVAGTAAAKPGEAGPSSTSASPVVLTTNGDSRPSTQSYGFSQGAPYAPYPYAAYSYFSTDANANQATAPGTTITASQSTAGNDRSTPNISTNNDVNNNDNTANAVSSPGQNQNHPQSPLKRPFTFAAGAGLPIPDAAGLEPAQKRTRHCCKCGSQDCKGKGGRSFCMNACQDCGKLDCKGRNSRRPDKRCAEAWA